ncbi:MAG: hypothetical protein P8Z30_09795, partial [Acidobacteriota bacterium]
MPNDPSMLSTVQKMPVNSATDVAEGNLAKVTLAMNGFSKALADLQGQVAKLDSTSASNFGIISQAITAINERLTKVEGGCAGDKQGGMAGVNPNPIPDVTQALEASNQLLRLEAVQAKNSASSVNLIAHLDYLIGELLDLQLSQAIGTLIEGRKQQDPGTLCRFEHKVFSQSGEDGIIAEIFRRVGTTNRFFVECAPGNGVENNTLYLLTLGWKGLWIESDPKNFNAIKGNFATKIKDGALRVDQGPALAGNFESLLDKASTPKEFDLLSLDIDGNDYWVWKNLVRYRPRVVVIEYNAIFPPGSEWVMDYDPHYKWDGSSNFGASLTALERLGGDKGYKLVGCGLNGVNA